MKRYKNVLWGLALVACLTPLLSGCGGKNVLNPDALEPGVAAPTPTPQPENKSDEDSEEGTETDQIRYTLSVPVEYQDQVLVQTPEEFFAYAQSQPNPSDDEDTTLEDALNGFSDTVYIVAVKEQVDALKGKPIMEQMAAFLCEIEQIDEDDLHALQSYYMNGVTVNAFAKGADDFGEPIYFSITYPDGKTEPILDQTKTKWSSLEEWVLYIPQQFVKDNALTPVHYTTTMLDQYLNQMRWQKDTVTYYLSFPEDNQKLWPLDESLDNDAYLDQLLDGMTAVRLRVYEFAPENFPEKDYISVILPDSDVQIDFALSEENVVRVNARGIPTIYRVSYEGEDTVIGTVVQRWARAIQRSSK